MYKGDSKGIYIVSPDGNVLYQGVSWKTGVVNLYNSENEAIAGAGKEYWFTPMTYKDRSFGGSVHYKLVSLSLRSIYK